MSKYVGFKTGKLHESHVISEYYCGGCGYPLTDHDSFCPECGGALRECDADTLESENAKLRELCKDIWNDACHFDEFWDYVHDDGTIYREDELPHYQERMSELRIEVEE